MALEADESLAGTTDDSAMMTSSTSARDLAVSASMRAGTSACVDIAGTCGLQLNSRTASR